MHVYDDDDDIRRIELLHVSYVVVVVLLCIIICIYIFNQKYPFTLNLFSLADISQIELKGHLICFDLHQMLCTMFIIGSNNTFNRIYECPRINIEYWNLEIKRFSLHSREMFLFHAASI